MGMDGGNKKTEGGLGNVAKSDFMDVIIEDETPMRHAKPGETGIFARAYESGPGRFAIMDMAGRSASALPSRISSSMDLTLTQYTASQGLEEA